MDQTTVWSALAAAYQVQYCVPYIDPNTLQPAVDTSAVGSNFAYKPNAGSISGVGVLSIGTFGDLTGTDPLSIGGQGDSYIPVGNQTPATVGGVPGFSVSTSRGTRYIPSIALTGDLVGEHASYAYLTSVAAVTGYMKTTVMNHYLSGASTTNPGGKIRWGTKQNAADSVIEYLELDETGALKPVTQGLARLGAANLGFKQLTLDYTISATIGAVAINKPCGQANIAAGASSVVITNSLISANSIVLAVLAANDATATSIKSVIPAAGSVTITVNANATANLKVNFFVINTDN